MGSNQPLGKLSDQFGFRRTRGGVHLARTMMLEELTLLLSFVNDPRAEKAEYRRAVVEDNCLGKRSVKNRELTFRHLSGPYLFSSPTVRVETLNNLYPHVEDVSSDKMLKSIRLAAKSGISRGSGSSWRSRT